MRRCNPPCYFNLQQPALLLRSPGTRFIQVHQSIRNPACIVTLCCGVILLRVVVAVVAPPCPLPSYPGRLLFRGPRDDAY